MTKAKHTALEMELIASLRECVRRLEMTRDEVRHLLGAEMDEQNLIADEADTDAIDDARRLLAKAGAPLSAA